MRPFTKTMFSAALSLSLLIPSISQAAALTSNQVSAIVMLLQSFGADQSVISSVQATLTGTAPSGGGTPPAWTSSTTPGQMPQGGGMPGHMGAMACIMLSRNLTVGSQGDDVKSLQQMLSQDPSSGFTGTATGFFGPITARAMMHFQMNNGIASSSTGMVGPLTRGFLERRCGAAPGGNGPGMMGTTTWQGNGQPPHMPPPPPPMMGSSTMMMQGQDGAPMMPPGTN